MRKQYLLASASIKFVPLAFDNPSVMPVHTGAFSITQSVIAAAEAAALGAEADVKLDYDLGARSLDSARMLPYWDLSDDLLGGIKTLVAAGTKYLPKFNDESAEEYADRTAYVEFTNVYRDILEGLAAKPFEQDVQIQGEAKEDADTKPPQEILDFAENVDGAGNTLTVFLGNTFFNGICNAIDWIYVDYPKVDRTVIRTREDEKKNNIRPFWSHVLGRNVLEATTKVIGATETLMRVRILEPGHPDHVRMFERLDDGQVIWSLWKKNNDLTIANRKWILIESGNISIGVIPLVPFTTGRRDGRTFYFYPPMSDAADTAKELYQQESGLKFAKTMTAYPMLAANGVKPPLDAQGNPKKVATGPRRVLYGGIAPDGSPGSWTYVSPDAACLKFLKDDIKETMDQLRELGKQPLTAQSGNLTVITTAVAAGKANTAVGAWGINLANTTEECLKLTAKWMNLNNYDPSVKIFDEYDTATGADDISLTALQKMRADRDISYPNYIIEMKRRKVIRPDLDAEKNLQQLLEETPSDDDIEETDANANNPPKRPQLVK